MLTLPSLVSFLEILKKTCAQEVFICISLLSLNLGSSVLEIFNSLLRHLRTSVDMRHSGGKVSAGHSKVARNYNEKGEIEFEEAIIDTMGELIYDLFQCFISKGFSQVG